MAPNTISLGWNLTFTRALGKSKEFLTGKIDGGQTTHISANNVKIGDFVDVEIIEATPFALKAILV